MATLTGTTLANHLIGTSLADTISGLAGNDVLEGMGGNDRLNGGGGADSLYGGDGADTLSGGRGNDVLSGGAGNDIFLFASGDGQDKVTDFAAGDVVKVSGYSSALSLTQVGANVVLSLSASDKITFSNTSVSAVQAALHFVTGTTGGGSGGTTINGTSGWDTLNGTAGNDTIYGLGGYDEIHGGGGNDRIYGGLGGDGLWGGAGADTFVYTTLADAPPYGLMYYESDAIRDFQSIDIIDLSGVDANSTVAGNQAFHFGGYGTHGSVSTAPGSLYVGVDGGYVWVFGYTDNSGYPTLFIDLSGGATPTASNFIF